MLDIKRSGSMADVIEDVRDIPTSVIPYATAAALTRTVKLAQAGVIDQMKRDFSRPTRYTLGATRIEIATKDKLTARIAVKDIAGSGSTRPESFLLPEVEGGQRNEKRFERALRYSGVLKAGNYAMPGAAAKLDAAGNVSAATVRQILSVLSALKATSATRSRAGTKLAKGRALKNDLFVGQPTIGRGVGRRVRPGATEGIYRREGKRLRPLFIFTHTKPRYAQRLDFSGAVTAVARDRFRAEFERASADILSRRKR